MSHYVWILDNGHGGLVNGAYVTPGKRSPVWPDGRQLFEGVFNRAVVALLSPQLTDAGIENRVLVPEPQDIPLSERVARAARLHQDAPNAILVSVHANAGGGTGWEVYTTLGQDHSDRLVGFFARAFQAEFPGLRVRADFSDGDWDKEASFYILRNAPCPALLTENLFMDTLEPDCRILLEPDGPARIAKVHFEAIRAVEAAKPV